MESIRLWLALTPKQFEDLNNGKEIQPDEYSKRFGLRKDPIAAVKRAQYFNDWTPEGPKGEFCAWGRIDRHWLSPEGRGGDPSEVQAQRISLARHYEGFGIRREWKLVVQVCRGRSQDRLSGQVSSQCIGFCSGSRPGGSARLGSRRQLWGEMQKLRRKSCQVEIGVE